LLDSLLQEKNSANMGSEKFCLRWNDFESNISSSFSELREDKDFFDVTLSCDDEQIQAHKLIISACSPFFRNVLRRNPHQNPLIYLKGVRFTDLQAILNFMYHGEVNVAQEDLNSFLAVAEDLKVKGLTQNQTQSNENSSRNTSSKSPLKSSLPRSPERASLPKYLNPNPSTSQGFGNQTREIQEVAIKAEPKDPPISYPTPPQPQLPPQPVAEVAAHEENSIATYHDDTTYEDYEQYGDDQHYVETNTAMDQVNMQQQDPGKGPLTPEDLGQYVVSDMNIKEYHCALCENFKAKLPSKVRNHLEAIHFPGLFLYSCDICDKTMKGRNALNIHKSTMHSKKIKNFIPHHPMNV